MKDKDNELLSKYGRNDGMTVPEGFFEDFAERLTASLPENADAEGTRVIPPKTVWQRIRPYVYMAAMFAGIWCMVHIFTMPGARGVDLSIDNNEVLSNALRDDNFIFDYIRDDVNDREVLDQMYEDSIDVDEISFSSDTLPESVL